MSEAEIELKLAFDPAQRQRLARLRCVTELAAGEGVTENLDSTYYDTPERAVAAAGAAWRIRTGGDGPVQTVKVAQPGGGASFRHTELETPIAGDGPDPARLTGPAGRALLQRVEAAQLAPVFATRFRRRKRELVTADGDRIEMAIDQGKIVPLDGAAATDGAGEPIAELELELKEGREAALVELARRINESVPLAPVAATKAARGYALADGAPVPAGVKARKVALERDASTDTAFAAILRSGLADIAANLPAAADGRDSEGVHQMRVALRRLRAAFDLFAPILPESAWAHEERLKALAEALGPAREWDVFVTELLPPVQAALDDEPALAQLAERAEAARREAYGHVRRALADGTYTAAVLGLHAWLAEAGWRSDAHAAAWATPIRTNAAGWLEQRYRKTVKRGQKLAESSERQRHKLRIQGKKLRYAGMFFAPVFKKKKVRPFVKALGRLQDELGHLNDIASARDGLAALDDGSRAHARAAALVEGWYARIVAEREAALLAAWAAFGRQPRFWPKPATAKPKAS